jgi:hypothetical protein
MAAGMAVMRSLVSLYPGTFFARGLAIHDGQRRTE